MKQVHILLVEDNEGDILLITDSLNESRVINRITILKDGEAAINFFKHLGDLKELPDLVVLDVNLPKKTGHEVLLYIKSHESFKHLPVIMLTTSSSEKDIMSAYKNYVNCYITKPIDALDFFKAISTIENFWINIVSMP